MFTKITKGNELLTRYNKVFSLQWDGWGIPIMKGKDEYPCVYDLRLRPIFDRLYVEKDKAQPPELDSIIYSFVKEKLSHLRGVKHCLVVPEKKWYEGNHYVLKIHLSWIDDSEIEADKIREIVKQLFNDFVIYELYEDFGKIKTKDIGGSDMLKFETLVEVSRALIEEIKNQKDKFDLNCIRIYPSDKAPEFLKTLCSDDVDWYALVPDDIYEDYYIGFLESSSFGTITHVFPIAGFRVVVGCHA